MICQCNVIALNGTCMQIGKPICDVACIYGRVFAVHLCYVIVSPLYGHLFSLHYSKCMQNQKRKKNEMVRAIIVFIFHLLLAGLARMLRSAHQTWISFRCICIICIHGFPTIMICLRHFSATCCKIYHHLCVLIRCCLRAPILYSHLLFYCIVILLYDIIHTNHIIIISLIRHLYRASYIDAISFIYFYHLFYIYRGPMFVIMSN